MFRDQRALREAAGRERVSANGEVASGEVGGTLRICCYCDDQRRADCICARGDRRGKQQWEVLSRVSRRVDATQQPATRDPSDFSPHMAGRSDAHTTELNNTSQLS